MALSFKDCDRMGKPIRAQSASDAGPRHRAPDDHRIVGLVNVDRDLALAHGPWRTERLAPERAARGPRPHRSKDRGEHLVAGHRPPRARRGFDRGHDDDALVGPSDRDRGPLTQREQVERLETLPDIQGIMAPLRAP